MIILGIYFLCEYIASKPLINAELIFSDVQQHLELLSGYLTNILLE